MVETITILRVVNCFILCMVFIFAGNTNKVFASISNKIAEECTDKKKITKAGPFFWLIPAEPLTRNSIIMKKHKRLLILNFVKVIILACFALTQFITEFLVYVVLFIFGVGLVAEILLFIFVLKFKKKQKNEEQKGINK